MASLTLKFKSGNDVPVTRTSLTAEEFEVIKKMVETINYYANFEFNSEEGYYVQYRGFEVFKDKGYQAKLILGSAQPGEFVKDESRTSIK